MRVDSLEKTIFDTIKGIDTIERYGEFLDFYGHGNIYCFSPENAIAIFAQNSKATLVGTYDMWKRYGRYPLKNVGIAVYPYNTSGVFGKFADYVYDVKDTKNTRGQEISMWKLSEEQRKEYFEWKQENYYRKEAQEFAEYLKLQFYEDVENSLSEEHSELLYGEQKVCHAVKKLLCESIMKVYMARCGLFYEISDDAGKSFRELLFESESGAMRVMFLMKCFKVVQEIAHREIQQVNYYFRKEKEARNNAKKSGRAIANSSRVKGDVENASAVGEANRKIPYGQVSGTDSDFVSEPRDGENLRPESGRGAGVLSEDVYGGTGKREGLEDGYVAEDTEGEPDSTGNPEYDRNRNIVPSTQFIGTQMEGQLNIFSYMNSVIDDNNVTTDAVTPDGLGLEQLEQGYRQPLDRYVDLILLSGVCGYRLEARYNIFNYYSARWEEFQRDDEFSVTAAQNFVKKQYLGASLGFVIDEQNVSVFYDNDGMKLAYGEESRLYPQLVVGWAEVEERIFNMVRDCRFIDAEEAELAKKDDEKGLIKDIIYYILDGFQGVDIATLPEPFNEIHMFPDLEKEVWELLHIQERASQLLDVMKKMWDDCEKGLLQPHWAYAHEYQRVKHLEYYLKGYTVFELPEHLDTLKVDFVPLDAFDKYAGIIADAGRAGDVERKYEYFLSSEEGNNISGLLQCMKRKFGEYSGEGYSGFQRNHTSRGFQIEIAKEYSSPFEGKAVRQLSGRAVAKRICSIMKSGQFFTKNEYADYPEWKNRINEYNAAKKKFDERLEKQRSEEREKNQGRKGFYPGYLTESERSALMLEVVKELIQNRHFDGVRKSIYNVLEMLESSQDNMTEQFAELVYELFQAYKDEIFYLQDADFAKVSIDYGTKTKFRNCLNCRCFPSNYIDTDGQLGSYNSLTLSFEQIAEGMIYYFHSSKEMYEDSANDDLSYSVRNRKALSAVFEKYGEADKIFDKENTEESQYDADSDVTNFLVVDTSANITEVVAEDFSYSADWQPSNGSDAERCRQNMDAIRMLKKLEMEKRQPSHEEQIILSKYVGWGGLSKYFDENVKDTQKQYKELKNLLTEEEYMSARASVTDSFYTPREVLDGVYQALERFGFQGGNILDIKIRYLIQTLYTTRREKGRNKGFRYNQVYESLYLFPIKAESLNSYKEYLNPPYFNLNPSEIAKLKSMINVYAFWYKF